MTVLSTSKEKEIRLVMDLLLQNGPLFDSEHIFRAANNRYAAAIAWIESQLKLEMQPDALWRFLQEIPPAHRAFFLRSAPIRAQVDNISELILQEKGDEKKSLKIYKHLRQPFDNYLKQIKFGQSSIGIDWAGIGFDLRRALTEPFPIVISAWTGIPESNSWSEALEVRSLFNDRMSLDSGEEQCVLRPIDSKLADEIESAILLLSKICPKILTDIGYNVRHICLIDFKGWESFEKDRYRSIGQSISSHLVPSCCFFSYHSFRSKECLAEAIFHEALHKKLSNLAVSNDVFSYDYIANKAPKFNSFWNRDTLWNSNMWEFDRALYAYHIYVYLTVFYALTLSSSDIELDSQWINSRYHNSIERALALQDWISENKQCLGDTGIRLIKELTIAVNKIKSLKI